MMTIYSSSSSYGVDLLVYKKGTGTSYSRAGVCQPADQVIIHCCQTTVPTRVAVCGTRCYDVVCSLLICTTLTGRRWSHTPFVHSWAEEADASSKAIKLDPSMPGKTHSRWQCVGLQNVVMESGRIFFPLHVPFIICPTCHIAARLIKVGQQIQCGRDKWVSRLKLPMTSKWRRQEPVVQKMPRLQCSAC